MQIIKCTIVNTTLCTIYSVCIVQVAQLWFNIQDDRKAISKKFYNNSIQSTSSTYENSMI